MSVWQNIRFLEAFNRFTGKVNSMNWTVSLIALIGSAASIYAPQAQAWILHHPQAGVVIAGLYSIFAHLMPSPVATGPAITAATDAAQLSRDMEQ
jgi:hypothetical protein